MDVEIRTLSGEVWVTTVNREDLADASPGAAAKHVDQAIVAGEPIRVARPPQDDARPPLRARRWLMVFNPGTVVSVAEDERRRGAL